MPETTKTADLTIGDLLKGLTPRDLLALGATLVACLGGAYGLGYRHGVQSVAPEGPPTEIERPAEQAASSREDRTGVIRPNETGSSGDAKSPSPPPTVPVVASREALRYQFDLLGCSRNGRVVECRLIVENLGDDRELYVSKAEEGITTGTFGVKGSRFFDEQSSEHIASSLRLANQSSSGTLGIGPSALLISGTRVPLELRFEGVSSEASSITRLYLNCRDPESESNFTVTFENIELSE